MEAGHEFLARLGKTKLRPGGVEGTNWLLEQVTLNEDTEVLTVACNRATDMIMMAERYGCRMTGVDRYRPALADAATNIAEAGLGHRLKVLRADARNLPFDDASFDIVMNEAMLTMMTDSSKAACIREYARVLRPGGALLTHDLCVRDVPAAVIDELRELLQISVNPLSLSGWTNLFRQNGFCQVHARTGRMHFLTPRALIEDEGVGGMLRIVRTALATPEDRQRLYAMQRFFRRYRRNLRYITVVSRRKS
ncbi:MAG: class I SAM-dependent methyltransferase [Eubacteriales bacterium]|nr:class I SAM-dependent methyltransferase [Eubacteriales bacterium]